MGFAVEEIEGPMIRKRIESKEDRLNTEVFTRILFLWAKIGRHSR